MQQVVGAPRSSDDWTWNNPISAVNGLLPLIRSLSVSSRYGLSTKAKLLNALLTGQGFSP